MRRQAEMASGQCDNSRIYTQCFGNVLEEVTNGPWELKSGHLTPGFKRELFPRETNKGKNAFVMVNGKHTEKTGMWEDAV